MIAYSLQPLRQSPHLSHMPCQVAHYVGVPCFPKPSVSTQQTFSDQTLIQKTCL